MVNRLFKKRIGKKGSITDLPYIIAGIFSVALVAFLVTVVLNNFNSEVQDNSLFNSDAKSASAKMASDFPAVMDGALVFLFFAMVFVSFILASLVPIHPVFLPFYLLEYLLLIWLGAAIANIYQDFTEFALFATEAGQYTLTIHFFQYFPFFVGVVGAILAIVMYKAKRSFTGG